MNLTLFGADDPVAPPGMKVLRGRLTRPEQESLVRAALSIAELAPFYAPTMRDGTPFRVEITSAGETGWTSDEVGYRYVDRHPVTKKPWPTIPYVIDQLAREAALEAGFPDFAPDTCLVNLYRKGGRLGLHRDDDERDKQAPIVSVSLGDRCAFRFGGASRSGPFTTWELASGDVVVFGGPARLAWHGVTRIVAGSSDLVPGGGRINLTIRKAR